MCPAIVAIRIGFSSLVGAQIPHQRNNDPTPLPEHTVGSNIACLFQEICGHGMRQYSVQVISLD